MKISFLMLTIDRFELTRDTWEQNIRNATGIDAEFEFLICDNGSKDRRVVDYFSKVVHYHRVNSQNEGVGHAFNQLYLRATGDIIVMVGPDLRNPAGWLAECVRYAVGVPNSGIIGIDWGHGQIPPISTRYGQIAHWLTPQLNRVFGTWVFKRRVIEEVGFFWPGYGLYGIEDSDFNERVNRAGFNSCYVPSMFCDHVGTGVHDSGDYRAFKDASLQANMSLFWPRVEAWNRNELGLRCELPAALEPI